MYNQKEYKNKQNHNSISVDQRLNSIYAELKDAIQTRYYLQEEQRELWDTISRGYNRRNEMIEMGSQIGHATHNINWCINQLTHIRKNHKAMNIAYNYLSDEIDRIEKIISKWYRDIKRVQQGRANFITSEGYTTTDTSGVYEYIERKEETLDRLKRWKEHMAKYRV